MVKSPLPPDPPAPASSAIRDLLELTARPHVTSLAGGLPHPESFPLAAIAAATADVLATEPLDALQYGPTEGRAPLRSWVADRLGTVADHVAITSGAQQAIDLLARTLVGRGGTVALADPSYVGAIQAFRAAGAVLAPIRSDRHGLRVDVLAEQLEAGLRPSVVYVVATFDNPTGTTLDARRRMHLAALAERYGFWIVDDDPYGELRWSGARPLTLRSLTDRTIALGSTSKVLCPGLRVGWLVAPTDIVRRVAILKQATDLQSSSLTQALAHRLLADARFLDAHLRGLRTTYRHHAQTLAGALAGRFGDDLRFAAPAGGMFLWATLSERVAPGRSTGDLLPTALDHGVAYVPGSAFAVAGGHDRSLRLSFATSNEAELIEAVDRLATAFGIR